METNQIINNPPSGYINSIDVSYLSCLVTGNRPNKETSMKIDQIHHLDSLYKTCFHIYNLIGYSMKQILYVIIVITL